MNERTTRENPGFDPAPVPSNEQQRLCALQRLGVLDTPEEARFDRIVELLKRTFRVPIAVVSLVDSERQWFKARVGLDTCETGRDISFCGHAVEQEDALVVENALLDTRFCGNPLVVGAPHIRFYAGAVLRSPDGYALGTACIIDQVSRSFAEDDLDILKLVAEMTSAELARRGVEAAA